MPGNKHLLKWSSVHPTNIPSDTVFVSNIIVTIASALTAGALRPPRTSGWSTLRAEPQGKA